MERIEKRVLGANYRVQGKKGDIPVTVLVIGVFAVCALALFTFFVADFKMSNSFVGLKIMEDMNSQIDGYLFFKNSGESVEVLSNWFSVVVEDNVKYIKVSQFSSPGFGLFGDEEELLFSVRYPIS